MTTSNNRNEPPAFVTLNEAAGTLGCTRRFLEKRITDGEIAVFRPSTRLIRIRRTEWERWITSYTRDAKGSP